MTTLKDILSVALDEHLQRNAGERHGVEHCSDCLLFAVLGIVASTARVLDVEAVPVMPVAPGVSHG